MLLDYFRLEEAVQLQKRVPLPTIRDHEILPALLSDFSHKCAFCEGRYERLQVHRFRPQSDSEPRYEFKAHIYYAWLADVWENLYPICEECRPENGAFFPVEGSRCKIPTVDEYAAFIDKDDGSWSSIPPQERPLLLDPCYSADLGEYLAPNLDGTIAGLGSKGRTTVAHFSLDRDSLTQRRKSAFERFAKSPTLGDDDREEFVGLWRLYQRNLTRNTSDPIEVTGAMVAPIRRPPPPRLKTVHLKNFKAIESLSVELPPAPDASEKLAQALLILGENAAGKSSILEAIALSLVNNDARQNLVAEPRSLRLDPAQLGEERMKRRRTAEVHLEFAGGEQHTLRIEGNSFKGQDLALDVQVFGYGAYRHFLRDEFPWQPSRPVISLFKSDNLLSNPEAWLLGLEEADYIMVVQALRAIFDAGDQFEVIERNDQRTACFVRTRVEGNRVARTPLSSVSSGFRTILALSCDVMRWAMNRGLNPRFDSLASARGIVLIDEVEAHLHPRWKIQIMSGLRRALPAMTFIVTTHDPLCLRGMRDGEVMVLNRVPGTLAGSSMPLVVDTLQKLPDVSKLTIEQLLTSDLFDLFTTDDAETEMKLAQLADYLSTRDVDVKGRSETVIREMEELREQIASALPIGLGEAGRMIQEEVVKYLTQRRRHSGTARKALRDETKDKIRQALESL